jgi:YVTN family beta-propeller protein
MDIALSGSSVWVTDPFDGTVWRIDPGPRPITRTIQLGYGVSHIAAGDGAVWVANFLRGTVSRINPSTNSTTTTVRVPGTPQGVAVGSGSAWISLAGGTLAGAVSSRTCSVVDSGGAKPDLVIASDLPLQAPTTIKLLPDTIRHVLASEHFQAGQYRIGYQSCDDSTAQEGAFDFFKCADNARVRRDSSCRRRDRPL